MMTNSFDAANRLVSSSREETTVEPVYNGVGDRVGQTMGATTTHFALDVQGLPEVIYTDEGELYLHLPGVIVTEKEGEVRYLLSDGLGSVRQAVDETGGVVAYNEFDPYGNPVQNTRGGEPYGYTGEWYESYIELLHLRARWYAPESGTFLSRDAVESEPPYAYVRGNPANRIDPSGRIYCDPVSGYCPEVGLFLCSHTPGAYDQRGFNYPCIVNPNNVQTGGPPLPPPAPRPSPPPSPSTGRIECETERACKVILAANKLANVSRNIYEGFNPPFSASSNMDFTSILLFRQMLLGSVPYHSYILVVDPNRKQHKGFPEPEIFEGNISEYVNTDDKAAVYYFGAYSERVLEEEVPGPGPFTLLNGIVGGQVLPVIPKASFWGKLAVRYGLYGPGALDYVGPEEEAYLRPQYELVSKNAKCDDMLRCLKQSFDRIGSRRIEYGAAGFNSNFAAGIALQRCGIPVSNPANNVSAPGWWFSR